MIVVDTNIVIKAFRSGRGASHALLRDMIQGEIEFALSQTMLAEYEDVLMRPGRLGTSPAIPATHVKPVLDVLCKYAVHVSPWFRFRPFLNDPKDDHVIECALAAPAPCAIITEDRHFRHPAVQVFGLMVFGVAEYVNAYRNLRRIT